GAALVAVSDCYLRPITSLTGKPRGLTLSALGLWPITRPGRLERARRMRPTEQCALRIRVFALASLRPIALGTWQRSAGGPGGGGSGGGGTGGGGAGGPGGGGGPGG